MKNSLNFFNSSFSVLTNARCSAVSAMSAVFALGERFSAPLAAGAEPSGVSSFAARGSGMFFRHFLKKVSIIHSLLELPQSLPMTNSEKEMNLIL